MHGLSGQFLFFNYHFFFDGKPSNLHLLDTLLLCNEFEPRHEKTVFLHMR